MEQLASAMSRSLNETLENTTREQKVPLPRSSPERVILIVSSLVDLALVKPMPELSRENSQRFYEIHAEKLLENGYSVEAVIAACDFFIHEDDERHPSMRAKFPLPDELRKRCAYEDEMLQWRKSRAQQLTAERERMANAPPAITHSREPHPWDVLNKEQVCHATQLVMRGASPEAARDQVLAA